GRERLEPSRLAEVRELGTHAGIVEAGADRVGLGDLAVVVLQEVGERAVQHARLAPRHRRAVLSAREPVAGSLDAIEPHRALADEAMEGADRVRAAADAGQHRVGKASLPLLDLKSDLLAD